MKKTSKILAIVILITIFFLGFHFYEKTTTYDEDMLAFLSSKNFKTIEYIKIHDSSTAKISKLSDFKGLIPDEIYFSILNDEDGTIDIKDKLGFVNILNIVVYNEEKYVNLDAISKFYVNGYYEDENEAAQRITLVPLEDIMVINRLEWHLIMNWIITITIAFFFFIVFFETLNTCLEKGGKKNEQQT